MAIGSEKASPVSADGLHNYILHERIATGSVCQVSRAVCKRGRMRNRFVAVKKIPHDKFREIAKQRVTAASLHLELCHPAIVTLISSFTAPSGYYQVLELCANGSLADFLLLKPLQALVEDELRGVARTLVDALLYLRNERVVHRDIKPSNVLISADFRLKLSGFSSAIRLPRLDATENTFCGSPNYISPEILSGRPYRFTTDLWSVGAVLVTCLTGRPAFHAGTSAEVFDNIRYARYSLPDDASYEVADLIAGFLQKNPEDRMPLHRILSHPFFKPSMITKPLTIEDQSHDYGDITGKNTHNSINPQRYPALLSTDPVRLRPIANDKRRLSLSHKRRPLEDITNLLDASQETMNLIRPPRRTASAPVNSGLTGLFNDVLRPPTPTLTADSGTPSVSSIATPTEIRASKELVRAVASSPRTQLKRVLSDPCELTGNPGVPVFVRPIRSSHDIKLRMPSPRIASQATATSSTAVSQSKYRNLAIRQSTLLLKPQTYKVSRGQLVILPSKALLIDFREGERRNGYKGKQVLLVNADGNTVEIYDAPHLSTPCCLAEPIASYSTNQLPQKYVKQYEDAMKIVDQLNARIPKLIHFANDARCTLMANGPPGDVEIHMPSDEAEVDREVIRLRLQRGKCTLEISRHLDKACKTQKVIGEWTRKIIPLGHMLEIPEEEWAAFNRLERVALARLEDFLRICEAAEAVEAGGGGSATGKSKIGGDNCGRLEKYLCNLETKAAAADKTPDNDPTSRPPSHASVVSSVVVRPRPRKLSSTVMLR